MIGEKKFKIEFDFGEIVFLLTDPDQLERMVIS